MREQTTALKEFDAPEEPVFDAQVIRAFELPQRNWQGIINSYNAANKRKFPFTPEKCKLIVEYVKQGHLPRLIFESLGISNTKFNNLVIKASELDEQLEILSVKEDLSEDEYNQFQELIRNPLRLLISDIARAEGVSKLHDWEMFNSKLYTQPDLLMAKMRARYKEFFNDKEAGTGNVQVQINLGGDFVSKM
jgi:hypothetical protein